MKKPVVLLIVLGALVGLTFVIKNNRENKLNSARLVGAKDREYLFPELPVKDVRQLIIREGTKSTTLAVEGDKWVVKERDGYPAAYDRISRAVAAIADLKVQGKSIVGKTALGKVNLLPPGSGGPEVTGLQVVLKNEKGDDIGSFVVGKSVESTGGASSGNMMGGPGQQRWVHTTTDGDTIWLIGETIYDVIPDPKEWVDKAFIDVQEIKNINIALPN
ncbi:MAG: hypothetical protein ACAI34_08155, partial [Verrucomicrobium sp.]